MVDKGSEGKADEVKGKVKETAGQATGDEELKGEGQGDQTKGNIKQAGQKVKDAITPDK
ncbi:MAG TPA: CsbD family protein [Actinomycetospora sp.]|nr:CsbD family protein [Actinomycetospora sp.]